MESDEAKINQNKQKEETFQKGSQYWATISQTNETI